MIPTTTNSDRKEFSSLELFLCSFICYFALVTIFVLHNSIVSNIFGLILVITLFGIGGYCFGAGIAKRINKK